MNLEERIEMAIKPEIEVWHSEHDPSMYRQKHEMAGQLIEFQDGFEKGYMAAMRDLFPVIKPEDLQEGGIYYAAWAGQPLREVYYDGENLCYWEAGGIGPDGESKSIERNISPDGCEVLEFVFPNPYQIFVKESEAC